MTPQLPATPLKRYFPALTGVRAFAAYAVFFYHFNPFTPGSILWNIASHGWIGVTLFFVLSGFLICLRYIDRLELSKQWLWIYLRNRVARIYPLYLLLTLLAFAVIPFWKDVDLSGQWAGYRHFDKPIVVFLNLTFLRGFFSNLVFTGVAQGWTLTVEECFYLLAPLMLAGLAGRKFPALRLALYAVGLLGFGQLLVRFAPHPFGFFSSTHFLIVFTFFGRCIEFLIGIGLALFVRRISVEQLSGGFAWRTYAGLLAGVACVFGQILVSPAAGDAMDAPFEPGGFFFINMLLPTAIALFFAGLIYERTPIRWLLETRLFDLLGKSSYAFYLVHMGVFSHLLARYVSTNMLVNFGLLILLSIALFRFVEEPLHRWLAPSRKPAPTIS